MEDERLLQAEGFRVLRSLGQGEYGRFAGYNLFICYFSRFLYIPSSYELDYQCLESEFFGVMKYVPLHLIPYVAFCAERYLPLFANPNCSALHFIRKLPEDDEAGIIQYQQFMALLYSSKGKKIFHAQSKLLGSILISSNITEDEYEMRFEEENDLIVRYQISRKKSLYQFKNEIEAKVSHVYTEKPELDNFLKAIKEYQHIQSVPRSIIQEINDDDTEDQVVGKKNNHENTN